MMIHSILILAMTLTCIATTSLAIPAGFTEKTLFDGNRMTDFAWMERDVMLVSLKEGIINAHYPGDDYEYSQHNRVLDIRDIVCTETERGLGSIALHPNFDGTSSNDTTFNFIYLYYTFPKYGNCDRENPSNGPVNRLSRWKFVMETNTIDMDSEQVLLDTPSTKRPHHNSGNIHFGTNDNLLYVSIGDCGHTQEAQNVQNVFGSIVRLTDDGGIPPANPFAGTGVRCHISGQGNAPCQELYAIGLRNPWRFSMEPNMVGGVRFLVNDVGAALWEEISQGGSDWENATEYNWVKGIQNFGWPVREGPCKRGSKTDCGTPWGYVPPLHYYKHDGGVSIDVLFVLRIRERFPAHSHSFTLEVSLISTLGSSHGWCIYSQWSLAQ